MPLSELVRQRLASSALEKGPKAEVESALYSVLGGSKGLDGNSGLGTSNTTDTPGTEVTA